MEYGIMDSEYSGEIVSSQLARYGDNDTRYGYVTIQTPDLGYVRIKVDAYTSFDTLDIGEQVLVESKKLGDTGIIVAKQISTQS
jgi:hypothetical protein